MLYRIFKVNYNIPTLQISTICLQHSTLQSLQSPNFAFSVPLAHYRLAMQGDGDTTKADKMVAHFGTENWQLF